MPASARRRAMTLALRGPVRAISTRRVDAGGAELVGGLLAVAAVGDEHQLVGLTRAAAPAEPVNPVS